MGLFFKEVVEMGRLFETQAVADLGNIPICMFEQGFGFAGQSFRDMARGRLACAELDGTVQMIYVDIQLLGKVPGTAEGELLRRGFDGELAFQQLGEYGRDPCVGILVLVEGFCRLHFQGMVHHLHDVIADEIVFEAIVGAELFQHFFKDMAHVLILDGVEHIGGLAACGVHGQLAQADAHMFAEKFFLEDAEIA